MGYTPHDYETIDRSALWHPYTQMDEYPGSQGPLIVARGEGSEVIDIHGRRYLDGYAQMWCNVWGHAHPRIARALHEQALKIGHSSLFSASSVPAVELTDQVLKLANQHFGESAFSQVFFSDNGSTAVEVALKMAVQYQQNAGAPERTEVLCFSDAYHGDTCATMTLGGVELFRRAYAPLTFGVQRALYPSVARRDAAATESEQAELHAALTQLEDVFARSGDTLACAIIEPACQGASGMRVLTPGYLQRLRELCSAHGVLLIADEVLVAFGRCGEMFGSTLDDVVPDILCIAKGLTAGQIPLALTLANQRVFSAFGGTRSDFRHFFHGHTFTGNQLGCAVALENLRMIRELDLMGKVSTNCDMMTTRLRGLEEIPGVGRTRQCGMMAGVPLKRPGAGGSSDDYTGAEGLKVCATARERGLLIRPLGDIVVVMPVLAMDPEDLTRLFDILEGALRDWSQSA